MGKLRMGVAGLAACLGAACAVIGGGAMRLPTGLERHAERVDLAGLDGRGRGGFEAQEMSGGFVRTESRAGVLSSVYLASGDDLGFSASGAGLRGEVSAACARAQDMSFVCAFRRDGAPMLARFELAAASAGGAMEIDGLVLNLRAVDGARGRAQGYLFECEGRVVGAMDLASAGRTMYLPERDEPRLREAALLASLALSLAYEPSARRA